MPVTASQKSHSQAVSIANLYTLVVPVGPFQLYSVLPNLLCLPGADIADFAVCVVVPALPRYRIRDGFTKLMRTGRRQSVQYRQTAKTARTARVWHYGVEYLAGNVIVVAAECLTRSRPSLHNTDSRRDINKVQSVWGRVRNRRIGGDFMLQHVLYSGVRDGVSWRWRRYRDGSGTLAVPNLMIRHTIFA